MLKAADGFTNAQIVAALDVGIITAGRIRKRFVEVGLEAITQRRRPGKLRKLDAKAQARLIAEACSQAPEDRKQWSLQLLADHVVELKLADSCSYEMVRRALRKQSRFRIADEGQNRVGQAILLADVLRRSHLSEVLLKEHS